MLYGVDWSVFQGLIRHFSCRESDYAIKIQYNSISKYLEGQMQIWVYGFNSADELDGTRARITLSGSESSSFEGPIVSAEIDPLDVEKDGLGLVVSSQFILRNVVD